MTALYDDRTIFMCRTRPDDPIAEMIEAFPHWRDQWEQMKLASDFVTTLHMGLLLQQPVFGEARTQRAQRLSNEVLRLIYAGKMVV